MHHFKSFIRVKLTQDEKVSLFKRNELKLTQVELFSFFHFKSESKTLYAQGFIKVLRNSTFLRV